MRGGGGQSQVVPYTVMTVVAKEAKAVLDRKYIAWKYDMEEKGLKVQGVPIPYAPPSTA